MGVKIGIIGSGFMARTHAMAHESCDTVDEIRLLALKVDWEQAEKLAADCAKISDIHDAPDVFLDSGIDAVDICTPTPTHADYVRRAAEAGKPVMCEKPLSLTSDLCMDLVREVGETGLPFMVAQVIRFWPEYVYLKDTVESGKLGNLRSISMVRYSPLPRWGDWFANLKISGGALFDLHIHDIDFLRFLLGDPTRVSGIGRKEEGLAYLDVFTAAQFENGVYANVYGSYDHPASVPFRMGYRALFEQGTVDYDIWREDTLRIYEDDKEEAVDLSREPDGYAAECSYFDGCVEGGKMPDLSSAESAAGTISLLEKISVSADQNGKWMDL